MRAVLSPPVWMALAEGDRIQVIEDIIRILTEEVENERFPEDSDDSSSTPSRGLSAAVESAAGEEESGKRN